MDMIQTETETEIPSVEIEAEQEETVVSNLCENCGSSPCKDGQMIVDTKELIDRNHCRVAVPNCAKNCWGDGYRAQHGEVVNIESAQTVLVRWVDGSVSQYNVYDSDHLDTDSVLCFNCIENQEIFKEDRVSEDSCLGVQDLDEGSEVHIGSLIDALNEEFDIVDDNVKDLQDQEEARHLNDTKSESQDQCSNCCSIPCKDGFMIVNTNQIHNEDCQVMVANYDKNYWGSGFRAQRGEVKLLESPERVTVRWVDGSLSQYNVHHSQHPESDSVLCFNCTPAA